MKKNLTLIIYLFLALTLGFWWYHTFTNVPTAILIFKNNGVEEKYEIAYELTTLIIKNVEDSAYVFYDKNGESLIIFNDVDWSKLTIKKK